MPLPANGHGNVRWLLPALLLTVVTAGCFHSFYQTRTLELAPAAPVAVSAPVRAHLEDGSVVIYRNGVMAGPDSLTGEGMWYDALRRDSAQMTSAVPMSRVTGLEAFETSLNTTRSLGTSLTVSMLAIGAVIAIACIADPKCFGSCPTVYTMTESGEVLEAELFSYSVAPLLEARDVDVIGTRADASGSVQLEIRNEALETHQINHLELLEVTHAPHERVVPDPRGRPLVIGVAEPAAEARDRTGRDVSLALAARDSILFSTSEELLAQSSAEDLLDHIDLAMPAPAGRDTVALVLRLRNSLLNTVLFYDMMLASAGARALDWLGTDLQRIGPAVQLGQWYAGRFGLWVYVDDGGSWREVARVPDAGPIAWKDVAVMVPVPAAATSLRVRLSFVMDEWRIDRVAFARDVRRTEPRTLPLSDVLAPDGKSLPDAWARLAQPDELYVETGPGHSFTARFEAGAAQNGTTRTFLLSAQGFYIEWIRPQWIRTATQPRVFMPGDATLAEALRRWQAVKPEFERHFYATRLPVR